MGFRDAGTAVVGADVTIDVEHPDRVGVSVDVTPRQGTQQRTGETSLGERGHPSAHGLDLGGAVQAEQASDVDGVDAGQSLDAGFADHRREHHGQHQ